MIRQDKKERPNRYLVNVPVRCCCTTMAQHIIDNARREACFIGVAADGVYANFGLYLHEWNFCPWCGSDWRESQYKMEL